MTTILGVIVGLGIMVFAIIDVSQQDPGRIIGLKDMYINLPSFLIVLGGTLASTLIAHPFRHLTRGFMAFFIVFLRREYNFVSVINHICDASQRYAKQGIPGLEEKLKAYKQNDLLKDGITMIVNGYKPEEVQEFLETNIQRKYDREMIDFYVFRTMGKASPAFGMVGTLVGLIFMLRVMSESPEKIGPFLAVALITTFYGVLMANLIFNPMGNKLLYHAEVNLRIGRMEIEGLMYVLKKQHPIYIKDKLSSYVPPGARKQLYKETVSKKQKPPKKK
ncbi:MAG: MotA/TolQ/ExbB proton channel family protein [Endomicrobiales bacterium]|nr:MotA/TolQ/ExbB proton channel family protein [Endomicrobiales bacterium]